MVVVFGVLIIMLVGSRFVSVEWVVLGVMFLISWRLMWVIWLSIVKCVCMVVMFIRLRWWFLVIFGRLLVICKLMFWVLVWKVMCLLGLRLKVFIVLWLRKIVLLFSVVKWLVVFFGWGSRVGVILVSVKILMFSNCSVWLLLVCLILSFNMGFVLVILGWLVIMLYRFLLKLLCGLIICKFVVLVSVCRLWLNLFKVVLCIVWIVMFRVMLRIMVSSEKSVVMCWWFSELRKIGVSFMGVSFLLLIVGCDWWWLLLLVSG